MSNADAVGSLVAIEAMREAIAAFNNAIRRNERENIEKSMQSAHDYLDSYFNHMIALRKVD